MGIETFQRFNSDPLNADFTWSEAGPEHARPQAGGGAARLDRPWNCRPSTRELLEDRKVARIPRLNDNIKLIADLAKHGLMVVFKVFQAQL